MIIHADLMLNGILRIEKYDNRIVLTNPGLLKLPIKQIYQGGESKARNQRMQNMFISVIQQRFGDFPTFLGNRFGDFPTFL